MSPLDLEFHHAMLSIYEIEKGHGYYAAYFKQMLDQFGGVGAAKRLLAKKDVQQGLMTLWEMDHLANSVEAHVLRPKFRELFTDEELAVAHQRLEDLEYKFEQLDQSDTSP